MWGRYSKRRANPETRTLAHVSDLHLGRSPAEEVRSAQLCRALVDVGVDHVLVTGDVTNRGRLRELAAFERAFAPLLEAGAVTVIPGNHDRLGDDLGDTLMPGERVQVAEADGLHIVRVNSTGDHNRSWIAGHGALGQADLDAVDAALDVAPADKLVVIAVHHHVLPLPEEHVAERLSSFFGWPFTAELERGRELLDRVRGRCGLVLHGHRHVPRGVRVSGADGDTAGTVQVFNAGSSTELGGVRVFEHAGGELVCDPWWLQAATRSSGVPAWAAEPPSVIPPLSTLPAV
jgi:3',5'-cyclic AMP phosphodiesterase CpdA